MINIQLKDKNNLYPTFQNLWRFISSKNKLNLYKLLILNTISGLSEFISLSLVVPFIKVLESSDIIVNNYFINFISDILEIRNQLDLKILVCLIFLLLIVVSGIIRTTSIFYNSRISADIGTQLSSDLFKNFINQDYLFYKTNQSSKFIAACTIYIKDTVTCINAILNILTSGFIIFFVILNLLNASKVFAFIYFIIIVIIYYFISNRTNFILKKNSKKISNNTDLIIKKIQESLISIRDFIIYQSEKIQYIQFYNYSK